MVGSTDAYQAEVNATTKLAEIQSRAKRDIFRIKCTLYTIAVATMFIAGPFAFSAQIGMLPKEFFYVGGLQVITLACIILAIQPQDRITVRIFAVISVFIGFICGPFFCLPGAIQHLHTETCSNTTLSPTNTIHGLPASTPDLFCMMNILMWAWQIPGCLLMGAFAVPLLRRKNGDWVVSTYAAYLRAFFIMRVGFAYNGLGMMVFGSIGAYAGPPEDFAFNLGSFPMYGFFCIVFAAFLTKKNLQRAHSWVLKVATRGETREAAGVAALMGKYGPTKTLQIAKERFRGIDFTDLSEIDFTDNGDSGLHVKTQKSRLGSLDAFMSHSWRDPGKPKFAALHKWAKGFQGRTGRHPKLWLDKACIDQDNIEESLAVLPVFLAGCRELLVVAGPSYTHRLWCVMEIYTFLRMGGTVERIHVLPAEDHASATDMEAPPPKESAPEGTASQDAALRTVLRRFEEFDVEAAECTMEKDKEHLLGVIEQGFGSFENFNELVRRTFLERVEPNTSQTAESTSHFSAVSPARVKPNPKAQGERRVTRELADSDDDDDDDEALTDEQKKRMDENRVKALG